MIRSLEGRAYARVLCLLGLTVAICAIGRAQTLLTDTHWTTADSPVAITEWVTVPSGVTLTIDPGVVVQINRYRGFTVENGGTLTAQGTSGSPITFENSTPDTNWSRIEAATGSTVLFEYCTFNRGGETDGALKVMSSGVTIRNCSINQSLRDGIFLDVAGIAPVIENVSITSSVESAIYQNTPDMVPAYANLSASSNAQDRILVRSGNIAGTAQLLDCGLPYLFESGGDLYVQDGGSLTIDPGVVVYMGGSGYTSRLSWHIQSGGTLTALGTELDPILITSAEETPTPGYWNRIDFNAGSTGQLQHCTVEYGGAGYRLMIVSTSNLQVSDCVFQHSSSDGITLEAAMITPSFERVTVQDCPTMPIWQSTIDMSPVYRDITLTNNGRNAIQIKNGTITGATTLTECGVPYYFNGSGDVFVSDGASFTIEPGVNILMGGNGSTSRLSWNVQAGGTFTAAGTELLPITMVSANEQQSRGDWNTFNIAAGASAVLSHCTMMHGGGMVKISSSSVDIDHCEFGFSSNSGVTVLGEGISPVLSDVTFTSNSLNGLVLEDRHQAPRVQTATFVQNGDYAIKQGSIDMAPFYENLTFQQNGTDGVHILARPEKPLTRDIVWDSSLGIVRLDYSPVVTPGASLTIGPGLEVRFGPTGSTSHLVMTVQDGGTLVANGTEQDPIVFTSYLTETPNRGDWDSILVAAGGIASFEHCLFEYGAQYNPAIRIQSSDVTLRNSRFRFLGRDGVNLNGIGISPTIENVDISDTGGTAFKLETLDMQPSMRGLSAENTARDVVWVEGKTLTQDVRISRCGLPYEMRGNSIVATSTTLTIDPGVTLLCNGNSLAVQAAGRLEARGTAAQPIRFIPFDDPPSEGEWWNIDFAPGSSGHLESCELAWGGGQPWYYDAMLLIGSSDVFVRNCMLHDGLGGIRIHSDAQPTLVNNQLYNGKTSMMNSTPNTVVDARFHWWGHPTGPNHYSINPQGQGMSIGNGILVYPWAISPDGAVARAGTEITLGEAIEATVDSLDFADFQLNLADGEAQNVLVRVDPLEGTGTWQLWGRRGLAPTEASHDWEGAANNGGFEFVIPEPIAGAYVFTVLYEDMENDPAPAGRFNISCEDVARRATHVTIVSGGNAGTTTQHVIGAGFEGAMQVELRSGATALGSFAPSAQSSSELIVPMDLSGLATGPTDVAVIWPDSEEQVMAQAFTIEPGVGPNLELWLDVNPFIRPNRTATMYLIYENTGDSDMDAPWVTIQNTDDVEWRLSSADEFVRGDIHLLATSSTSPASILPPGETNRIPISYRVDGEKHYSFDWSWYAADTGALDLETYKDTMRPAYLTLVEWDAVWPGLKTRLGSTWAELRAVLYQNAARLQARGQETHAIHKLLDLEIRAEAGLDVAAISGVVTDGQTGAAKSGVAVTALSEDESLFAVGITDSKGRYVIPELTDTTYLISVDGYGLDPYPQIEIIGQSDINGLDLVAWPLAAAPDVADNVAQDLNPDLVAASGGEVLLAWEHGGTLRTAQWSGGAWTTAADLADANGQAVSVAWHEELFGVGEPGYVAVWQSIPGEAEAATIYWSVGKVDTGNLLWTTPVQLTSDANEDTLPEVVVDDSGIVMVFWLQRNTTGTVEDDSDLYFAAIDVNSAGSWPSSTPTLTEPVLLPTPDTVCDSWEFGIDLPVPPPADKTIGKKFALGASGQACRDAPSCKGFSDSLTAELKVTLGGKLDIGGNVTGTTSYYLKKPQCYYMKKSTTIAMNGILQGTVDTPIPVLIGGIPVGTLTPAITAGGSLGGKLGWFANQPGSWPHYGSAELALNSGGKANFTDYLGATDLGAGFDITGAVSYTFGGPKPGASADQLCLTIYGTISVFRGIVNKKFTKKMGGRCSSKEDFRVGHERIASRSKITEIWRTYEEGYPVIETLETTIDPFVGTDGVYEGTPVVADVASDLYHDGPAVAMRTPGGGAEVIWKKETGNYATALGSLVTIASCDGTAASNQASADSTVSFSNDPSMVYDGVGDLVAVWARADSTGLTSASDVAEIIAAQEETAIVIAKRTTGVWSAPASLTTMPPGQNDRPRIAIDSSGNMAVVWLNSVDGEIIVWASGGNGSTWSMPTELSRSPLCGTPTIAATGTGFLAVWSEDTDGDLTTTGDSILKYATSANGSVWSSPSALPAAMYPAAAPEAQPAKRAADDIADASRNLPSPPPECCKNEGCPPKCPPSPPPTPAPPGHGPFGPDGGSAVVPRDPNEKVGPDGWGARHIIETDEKLVYSIYFENKSDATVPAQDVFVVDDLPDTLDWTTFRVTEIAWGDVTLPIVEDAKAVDQRVVIGDYREDVPAEYWVDVTGELDRATGRVQFVFHTIDPATGEWPEDAFAGFLPPNDETGRGEGRVVFSVNPKPDQPLDLTTVIANTASIVFDTEDVIVTNEVLNTLGDIPQTQADLISDIIGIDGTPVVPLDNLDLNEDGVRDASDLTP
ncbi:hypothetical protein KQI84_17300 [bacterium]|nr:hypothetical protein [bacterium]